MERPTNPTRDVRAIVAISAWIVGIVAPSVWLWMRGGERRLSGSDEALLPPRLASEVHPAYPDTGHSFQMPRLDVPARFVRQGVEGTSHIGPGRHTLPMRLEASRSPAPRTLELLPSGYRPPRNYLQHATDRLAQLPLTDPRDPIAPDENLLWQGSRKQAQSGPEVLELPPAERRVPPDGGPPTAPRGDAIPRDPRFDGGIPIEPRPRPPSASGRSEYGTTPPTETRHFGHGRGPTPASRPLSSSFPPPPAGREQNASVAARPLCQAAAVCHQCHAPGHVPAAHESRYCTAANTAMSRLQVASKGLEMGIASHLCGSCHAPAYRWTPWW